jgi:hypothetical protein
MTLKAVKPYHAAGLPSASGDGLSPDIGFRDLRIDLIRGVSLLVIYIDHIPNNAIAWFTLHRFAFIDCADVFVFISGYAAGLVFTRTLSREGLRACFWRAWRRCGQLYLAHILISSITLVIFYAFLLEHVIVPEPHVYTFVTHPYWVTVYILLLQHMPYLLNILPLFVVFIGGAPFLAWALRRHWAFLFLVLVVVYSIAQLVPGFNFHSYPGHEPWVMNIFAWQLIFAIGFLFGNRHVRGLGSMSRIHRSHLIFAALGLLVFVAVRVGQTPLFAKIIHTQVPLSWLPLPRIPFTEKMAAEPLRVLNLLLMAIVVGSFDRRHPFWQYPVFRPFIVCGQNSLVVFCVGVVLSAVASCVTTHFEARWLPVLLSVTGCFALISAGQIAHSAKDFVTCVPCRNHAAQFRRSMR